MLSVALWTTGLFASLYAGHLNPELRVTSSTLSAVVNGAATIIMFVFIAPLGALSGMRPWKDVSCIEDTGEEILIVGTNRNAMVVPKRAFKDDAARRAFLEDAKSWHAASAI